MLSYYYFKPTWQAREKYIGHEKSVEREEGRHTRVKVAPFTLVCVAHVPYIFHVSATQGILFL